MAEAVSELRARFLKSTGKEELSQRLREILPLDDFDVTSIQGATNNFHVIECIAFWTKSIKNYNVQNNETLRKINSLVITLRKSINTFVGNIKRTIHRP